MIAKKLLELQREALALRKDKTAYKYNYLSGDKLLSVVRPKMDALGLVLMPSIDAVEAEKVGSDILYRVTMTMTWIDAEDGEERAVKWFAAGLNGPDKGVGSALTYGERYYLMKTLHIQTDRDDLDALKRAGYDVPAPAPSAASDSYDTDFNRAVRASAEGKTTTGGKDPRVWLMAKWGDSVDIDWDKYDSLVEAIKTAASGKKEGK